MSRTARNAVFGVIVAVAGALVLANASIGGIQAWKIVLAIVGFLIFASGSRARASRP